MRFARVLVAVVLAGCGFDPTIVLIPGVGGPAPQVQLDIQLLDAGDTVWAYQEQPSGRQVAAHVVPPPGVMLVVGTFWPGTAARGVVRSDGGAIQLNGRVLRGKRANTGAYWFGHELPAARTDSLLAVRLPESEGFRSLPEFTLRIPAHSGEPLRLHQGLAYPGLVPVDADVTEPVRFRRWHWRSGALTIAGEGPLRRFVGVPVDTTARELRLELFQYAGSVDSESTATFVQLTTRATLRWPLPW